MTADARRALEQLCRLGGSSTAAWERIPVVRAWAELSAAAVLVEHLEWEGVGRMAAVQHAAALFGTSPNTLRSALRTLRISAPSCST